jgi:hypothetical protein
MIAFTVSSLALTLIVSNKMPDLPEKEEILVLMEMLSFLVNLAF